jgi:hypothetical protein
VKQEHKVKRVLKAQRVLKATLVRKEIRVLGARMAQLAHKEQMVDMVEMV